MAKKLNAEKLNENERKALDIILDTCDDIGEDYFTRMEDIVMPLLKAFDWNGQVVGGYITDLMKKGFLDEEPDDFYGMGLWVNAERAW